MYYTQVVYTYNVGVTQTQADTTAKNIEMNMAKCTMTGMYDTFQTAYDMDSQRFILGLLSNMLYETCVAIWGTWVICSGSIVYTH
jgi:hypothetical protein